MRDNIDGLGQQVFLRSEIDSEKLSKKLQRSLQEEEIILKNFIRNCAITESFTDLRKKTRIDLEDTGNAYWEIVPTLIGSRDLGEGKEKLVPGHFKHVNSSTMRITHTDEKPTIANIPQLNFNLNTGLFEIEYVNVPIYFRRYVQICNNSKFVFFKHPYDPRIISKTTGKPIEPGEKLEDEERANPIIHYKLFSNRSPYGIPRWVGNFITILGDRSADEINYMTITRNNVPSMAILISGHGRLTSGSIDRIQQYVEKNITQNPNYSQFLLLEAEPLVEDAEGIGPDNGNIKIEIKPLSDVQIRDALFQTYSQSNSKKIAGGSFRLPKIYLGDMSDSGDIKEQRKLTEQQVFDPERRSFDEFFNDKFLPLLGIAQYVIRTNTPNLVDNDDLIRTLYMGERSGTMTPRKADVILATLFNRDFKAIDRAKYDKIEPDIPFSLQLAKETKNQNDTPERVTPTAQSPRPDNGGSQERPDRR